jgi:hypothetical protein
MVYNELRNWFVLQNTKERWGNTSPMAGRFSAKPTPINYVKKLTKITVRAYWVA